MDAAAKRRFQSRAQKKVDRIIARGGTPPVYYVQEQGKFHGGPDLASSATYPWGFTKAVFKLWEDFYVEDLLRCARESRR